MRWKAKNYDGTKTYHTYARSIGQAHINFRAINLGLPIEDRIELHRHPYDPNFTAIVEDPDPDDEFNWEDH